MTEGLTLDLVVLVADADAEWTVRTLIGERYRALGIRPGIRFEVVRHPQRDSGVYLHSHDFLRGYLRRAKHAIVMLDREGSGREQLSAEEMELDIESRLARNGWDQESAVAIVLDPELEVWVWSPSPHVAEVIGIERVALQEILDRTPTDRRGKPERPKETLQKALRRSGRPFSARIFQELAGKVSLQSNERSFDKLKSTLQKWFPETS